jgi:hypothetical protein
MALGTQVDTATENGINSAVRNGIQNGSEESESSCSVTRKGSFCIYLYPSFIYGLDGKGGCSLDDVTHYWII